MVQFLLLHEVWFNTWKEILILSLELSFLVFALVLSGQFELHIQLVHCSMDGKVRKSRFMSFFRPLSVTIIYGISWVENTDLRVSMVFSDEIVDIVCASSHFEQASTMVRYVSHVRSRKIKMKTTPRLSRPLQKVKRGWQQRCSALLTHLTFLY